MTSSAESITKRHRAFIGCAKEVEEYALSIQKNLDHWCYPEIWSQGFFAPSRTNIENLERKLPEYQFAVFLLTPEDVSVVRDRKWKTARDNLIFELGMAIAFLGRIRTFIICPKDSGLKLPTDILSVNYLEYNPDAPNKEAALAPACDDIRNAIEQHCPDSLNLLSVPSISVPYHIHPHHFGDAKAIIDHTCEMLFAGQVIRRNWTVDLSYDFDKIDKDIIIERMMWDYEFANISTDKINYPLKLIMLTGDVNRLVSFTKVDSTGQHVPVFQASDATEKETGIFLERQRTVTLDPGVSYFISMQFLLEHSVSPKTHYLHNALAPIQPTLTARIRATIPPGYRMDLLAEEPVVPSKFEQRWDFILPGPLLPEQIIEYIFQKDTKCKE